MNTQPHLQARLVRQLGILSQLFQSRAASLLSPLGLSYSQMALLTHLEANPEGATITQLAQAIDIQQPGVSKAVARLEDLDAVSTEREPGSPRGKRVHLNAPGRELLASIREALTPAVDGWFGDSSDAEPQDLLQRMQMLSQRIADPESPGLA